MKNDLFFQYVGCCKAFSLKQGRGGSKLDWEVHAVLVDIFPFLKTHLDDTCTPALLEAVRILAVQLVPPAPPGGSLGQLEALLEDALLKFQGCRYFFHTLGIGKICVTSNIVI